MSSLLGSVQIVGGTISYNEINHRWSFTDLAFSLRVSGIINYTFDQPKSYTVHIWRFIIAV